MIFGKGGCADLIISDAERRFDTTDETFDYITNRTIRSTDIMMLRLSTEGKAGLPPSVTAIRLQDDAVPDALGNVYLGPSLQHGTRNLRTDLDRFSGLETQLLYYKGYGAARAAFENRTDLIDGYNLTDGIPATATRPKWLPIASNNADLVIAKPEEALRQGAKLRLKLPWTALLIAAIAALLCWPLFSGIIALYQFVKATPVSLAYDAVRASDIDDSAALQGRKWLVDTCSRLEAGERAYGDLQGVIISEPFGNRTLWRNTQAFQVRLEGKPSDRIRLSDVQGFVLAPDSDAVTLLTLERDSEGMTLIVPESRARDRLAIAIRLRNLKRGDDSFDVRSLKDLFTMIVQPASHTRAQPAPTAQLPPEEFTLEHIGHTADDPGLPDELFGSSDDDTGMPRANIRCCDRELMVEISDKESSPLWLLTKPFSASYPGFDCFVYSGTTDKVVFHAWLVKGKGERVDILRDTNADGHGMYLMKVPRSEKGDSLLVFLGMSQSSYDSIISEPRFRIRSRTVSKEQ
jgi:hypothetical protein